MTSVDDIRFHRGTTPLLISVPHAGTALPDGMLERLTDAARPLPDTDWYVSRLYRWARDWGAGVAQASCSRYLIDLNRPPDNAALYASGSTGLVPLSTFRGEPVWLTGREPDAQESARRLDQFWRPYHQLLSVELESILQRHGYALLLDAHSIAGELPLLFEGVLPDLNLGSNGGTSADAGFIAQAMRALRHPAYSTVLDGRFRGGYITRHYGRPERNIHALQLEISQRSYMQESPPVYQEDRARKLQSVLKCLLRAMLDWRPSDG